MWVENESNRAKSERKNEKSENEESSAVINTPNSPVNELNGETAKLLLDVIF